MSEVKFDLDSPESAKLINDLVSNSSRQMQQSFRHAGRSVVVVKNSLIVNTAVELAAKTVLYHGIPKAKISNCKKFAHVCFWMIKLHPVGFVRSRDIVSIAQAIFSKVIPLPDSVIEIADDKDVPADGKLNHTIALFTFATLVCDNFYEKEEAEKKVAKFMESTVCTEILRSIQFHNYSARTLAMYLESFVQDRIL